MPPYVVLQRNRTPLFSALHTYSSIEAVDILLTNEARTDVVDKVRYFLILALCVSPKIKMCCASSCVLEQQKDHVLLLLYTILITYFWSHSIFCLVLNTHFNALLYSFADI